MIGAKAEVQPLSQEDYSHLDLPQPPPSLVSIAESQNIGESENPAQELSMGALPLESKM